jgi:acyl carrier protein
MVMQNLDNATDKYPTVQLRRQFNTLISQIKKRDSDNKASEHAKIVISVTDAIRVTVAGMLFIDSSAVILSSTVADHEIDSLLAAEFGNWLHGAFGKNISMLDLMDARMKINVLAQKIVDEAAT